MKKSADLSVTRFFMIVDFGNKAYDFSANHRNCLGEENAQASLLPGELELQHWSSQNHLQLRSSFYRLYGLQFSL